MGKPTLALLGGFSSSAVYRILDRLVTALETVVSGDPRDAAALQGRLWEAKMSEREAQARLEAAEQQTAQKAGADDEEPQEDAGEEPSPVAEGDPGEWDEVPVRATAGAAASPAAPAIFN